MTTFPEVSVLIGFLAASNTANTGPYMTFNDANYGKFDTGQFASDYIWADVTTDVRSITTTRGRQRQIEAFAAGTATVVLDNNAGNYDPDNPLSIYNSPANPTLFTDTFNRADSTASLGQTSGPGTLNPFPTWSANNGTWGISSNQAYLPSGTLAGIATIDTLATDVDLSVTLATRASSGASGVVFRYTDSNNYLVAYCTLSGVFLYKNVAGTLTQIGTNASNFALHGDTMRVLAVGTSITVFRSGSVSISVTETSNTTGTKAGLYIASDTSVRLDDWTAISVQAAQTSVLPMRPISISASWNGTNYPIFYGYVDAFQPDYAPGKYSDAWCTVTASDAMKILQNIPSSGVAPAELTSARISRILDNGGWPATLRTIATGNCTLQATTLSATLASDIQASVDSEYGRWYIGADGKVIFENRSSRSANQTAISTWSDSDTNGNLYSEVGRVIDDDLIRNQVTIQNIGGTAQTLTDSASVTQYQGRAYSASNLLLTADSDAYQLANLILYYGKQLAGCRFDQVRFEPVTSIAAGAAGDLWPEVLGRLISDRVSVVVTPPNVSPMTMGAFIEGVSHTITTEPQNWTTTFHASRSAPTNFIEFNDATYGVTFAASSASGNTIGA